MIDGFKWDARVYVLVTSVEPLTVYVAREGLGRFCTEMYRRPSAANLDATYAHLTNYALNKNSPQYQTDAGDPSGGQGSKRALSAVLQRIEKLSRSFTVAQFWRDMDHIVAMTLLSLQPELMHRQATEAKEFHLLGFDVLLDSNERVSLLEVNGNPSLSTDVGGYNASTGRLEIRTCAVDFTIKSALVQGVATVLADEESGAVSPSGVFHQVALNAPEYCRISRTLVRLAHLQRRALRVPAAVCGERAGELGPSRLTHLVRSARMLSTQTEPAVRGSGSRPGERVTV